MEFGDKIPPKVRLTFWTPLLLPPPPLARPAQSLKEKHHPPPSIKMTQRVTSWTSWTEGGAQGGDKPPRGGWASSETRPPCSRSRMLEGFHRGTLPQMNRQSPAGSRALEVAVLCCFRIRQLLQRLARRANLTPHWIRSKESRRTLQGGEPFEVLNSRTFSSLFLLISIGPPGPPVTLLSCMIQTFCG